MKLKSLSYKLSRHIQLRRSSIVDIAIISAVGLLSITWFRGNFLIAAGDMLFPPSRWQTFLQTFYVWDSTSLGAENSRILAGSIPYEVFRALTEIIGLSLVSAEKLWFYLLFTSSGLSMYYLTTTAVKGGYRRLAGVTSALFFMLNPYVAIYVIPYLWIYIVFLPLILGLYIKGLNERKGLKYVFLMCIVWVLTSSAGYVNPGFAIIHWATLFLYLVFHIIVNRNKDDITRSLRFTGILLALWSALNAYWILPVAYSLKETIVLPLNVYQTIGTTRLAAYQLNSAPLVEALRLLGFWGLHSGYKGFPYFYWAPAYETPVFIAIGFLIPLLAFTSLLYKPRNKHVLFFGLVTIMGLFLMNGTYPPFGWINVYLVTHIPFAIEVLSAPYQIGGVYVVLGYAFLLGYAISILFNRIFKVKLGFSTYSSRIFRYILVGFILFLIVGVYAFPLWTGDVIYPGNEIIASARFNIPAYYYNASNWLDAQSEEFNIFPLPYSIVGYGAYTWEPKGFNGPDPTEWILHRPVVSSLSGGGIGMYVARLITSNSTDEVAKILALMNVRYVLFHQDANWKFLEGNGWYIPTSSKGLQSILKSPGGLYLEKSFGALDFYRNEYWRPLHIYATPDNILVDGNLSQMIQIAERDDFKPGESVLLLSDQIDAQRISMLPLNIMFFQGNDFLNLLVSKVEGYTIPIPSDASVSTSHGNIVVSATFSVNTTYAYDFWIEIPYTPSPGEISVNLDGSSAVDGFRLPANGFLASSWINLGKIPLPKGTHTVTLTVTGGEPIPEKIVFTPDQAFNSTYDMLSSALRDGRIVYVLKPQPLITARYYSGWKGVISTNGQGDPDMLIFPSPEECPYIDAFPPQSPTGWNAYNSTLIYITTGSSPLTINSVLADGTQVSATAWWQTDTSWRTGWPITIPPSQRAIIQVNQPAGIITLETDSGTITLPVIDGWTNPPLIKAPSETSTSIFIPKAGNYLLAVKVATGYGSLLTKIDDQNFIIDANSQEQGPVFAYKYIGPIYLTVGYHQISTSGVNVTIPVSDGWTNPINWTSTFTNQSYAARYYANWKAVVRTDGSEPWDTLSFSTIDQSPYTFPQNFTDWNAYNSTLVYIHTGDKPLRIDEILADGKKASVIGVWWETGWMGMTTKPITYPILIPPHQKAIIQINHKADVVTLKTNPPKIGSMLLYSLKDGENFVDANNLLSSSPADNVSVIYEEINPTKYIVHVNASKPFFLVFSESYHKDWIAYVDGQQVPNEYHFMANGFANAWYINKTGTYTITLEFWPQRLFYIGSAISITTLITCTLYISKDKIKATYKRYKKKP